MNCCRSPKNAIDFEKYYHLRWQVLRQPWQQPKGSEKDDVESQSFHRMVTNEVDDVLAVGRLERTGQYSGQIRYMAVSDAAQGQGLGKQIIQSLEVQAQQLGITDIVLNAREQALGFYEKLGYQLGQESHVLFDVIKHYQMSKTLQPDCHHQADWVSSLQSTWHETIPVSKAMGIEISYFDRAKLITHCDPDFNKNLHHTMFAGSIYTLATLTGWGWVYLQLAQNDYQGDIVLADANIRYHAPISGVAHAQVDFDDVTGDLSVLTMGKKAKIVLSARLFCGDKVAATFSGTYFIIPKNVKKL